MLRFRNTHEWCRGQTTPYVAELQDVPTTLIAWLHKYMVKGRAVAIRDVHKLPRVARTIQVEFIRQGNKSVLSVPILNEGKLYGVIGFRSEEHTSELQSLMRISYAVFCLKTKSKHTT